MKNTMKKVVAVLVCVCCAVSLFAFSASADEVLFNGTLTFDDEKGLYLFPSIISLTVGDFYSLTYNGETISSVVNPPLEDMAGPYVVFSDIAMLTTADLGDGDRTVLVFLSEEPPATIDIILSKGASGDQSEDQVVFDQSLPFEKLSGSYSVISPSGLQFIVGREYLVEVNGIERQYTAELKEIGGDTGIVLGPVPNVEGEISVTTTDFQGTPTIIINADNLLPGEGTYPVKITLLGIKPPHFSDQIGSFASNMFSVIGISASSIGSNSILSIFLIGLPLLFIVIGILFTLLNRKKNRGQRGYYKRYKRR